MRCVITGQRVKHKRFQGFSATHIFPLAHQAVWDELGFNELITDPIALTGTTKRDSVQNGLLLEYTASALWDSYLISIHPETWRVCYFTETTLRGVADGTSINFDHCSNTPEERPLAPLLRDHFRQCVLAHVKGAGSTAEEFDYDFAEGQVDLSEVEKWADSPTGKEMLELELARRLARFR